MQKYYDLGTYSRTITTSSAEAQLWFDRGLIWCYGFNHQEAAVCFDRAIKADPDCAIAYWGLAYVKGCNYNKPWVAFDPDDARQSIATAFAATQAATSLKNKASSVERLLIEALPSRYQLGEPVDDLTRWNDDFASAMREAYKQAPDDPEVATVFAEALMNRTPWQLWDTKNGVVALGADTDEVVAVIERAFAARSGYSHPGLLHMYIHTMEMSPFPERALPAANALRNLVPDAGHLNHMPSHIDVLVGDYLSAISSNSAAIEADRRYLAREGALNFYTLYRCHNYHFKIYAAMFAGRFATALDTADEMIATLPDDLLRVESPPMANWLEGFVSIRQHVLIRFGRWRDILAQDLPQDQGLFSVTTAMIWYAKAVANGVIGDIAAARTCAAQFDAALARVPAGRTIFNNRFIDILAIAREMMLGEIAYREGRYEPAFAHLRKAVELDDSLPYDEPWGWMQPARHALGALLLEQGHVDQAASVYRADLGIDSVLPRACRHPENIWSLSGYHECLLRQSKAEEADRVAGRLRELEKLADVQVRFSCFCRKRAFSQNPVF